MNIAVETHSHTLASAHAYSTVTENARAARLAGLAAIAVTDHGPALDDSPHAWHFSCMDLLPDTIEGVRILRGAEVNILDDAGRVDLEEDVLRSLDFCIASMHTPVYQPSTPERHTAAWLSVAENPLIDVVGHSGDGRYVYDYERVIPVFGRYNKAVEINNHSFAARWGSKENCPVIARLCMRHGVPVVVSSDAHICTAVGCCDHALDMLRDIGFPERLILNAHVDRFFAWLSAKKNRPELLTGPGAAEKAQGNVCK